MNRTTPGDMQHSRTSGTPEGNAQQQQGQHGHAPRASSIVPSSSRSSFMAQFYTPMNPGADPAPAPAPLLEQQPQQPQQPSPYYSPTATGATIAPTRGTISGGGGGGTSLGPDAALLVARLAATPGFLTSSVIAEARQEYMSSNEHLTPPSYAPPPPPLLQRQQQQYQQYQHYPYQQHNQQQYQQHNQQYYQQQQQQQQYQHSQQQEQQYQQGQRQEQQYQQSQRQEQQYSIETQPLPLKEAVPEKKPKDEEVKEDYVKQGKMTSTLIRRLAEIVESSQGTALKSQWPMLQKRQNDKERELFEQRQELTRRHAAELNNIQAKEIMGVNVAMERKTAKKRHALELLQYDKDALAEWDEIMIQQKQTLTQAGIPLMHPSRDPVEIGLQVKIMRLLEDMLNS